MNPKILFVDDDANILAAYQRNLRRQFLVDTALGGAQALAQLNTSGPYAVVVADMQMPNMNVIDFLQQAETRAPDTVRIMLTGNADQKTAVDAVNQGRVFRFLNKPCSSDVMAQALQAALRQYQLVIAERELLEDTLNGAVKVLADVLSTVDPQAFGRGRQLRDHMRAFLGSFKVSQSWELELAATLSPIGRVTLPPIVLLKQRSGLSLTQAEREMTLRVPQIGAELLGQIPRLENVAQIVRLQNKDFDGSGFPADGPSGDDIPVGARILRVLGDLAELESQGASPAEALQRMQQPDGRYDPHVLGAACRCFDVALPEITKVERLPVQARIEDLQPGQVLAEDVKTADSPLVVAMDTALSPMLVERLRNFHELASIPKVVLVRA
jgi:response regulator RpfG family c-di-GMP phosphodiesterase